ncbi:MAG: hypothetical protein WCH65_03905 [bacterium]
MKEIQYYQTTEEEILSKKKNIFIAICLGNKFFLNKDKSLNKENMLNYIHWALENTKDKLLIVIADEIQLTNYIVRNKNSVERNIQRIRDESKIIESDLNEIISTLSKKQQEKIKVIKRKTYEEEDEFYKKTVDIVYQEFNSNEFFKATLFEVTKKTVNDRNFTNEEYTKLCKYVLDEFSLIYSGVRIDNIHYDCLLYPYMDPTGYFFEEIKNKKIFVEIEKKLPSEKVAYVIKK